MDKRSEILVMEPEEETTVTLPRPASRAFWITHTGGPGLMDIKGPEGEPLGTLRMGDSASCSVESRKRSLWKRLLGWLGFGPRGAVEWVWSVQKVPLDGEGVDHG